jgi:hypothetical protein
MQMNLLVEARVFMIQLHPSVYLILKIVVLILEMMMRMGFVRTPIIVIDY